VSFDAFVKLRYPTFFLRLANDPLGSSISGQVRHLMVLESSFAFHAIVVPVRG
jgi:hypothetical protein